MVNFNNSWLFIFLYLAPDGKIIIYGGAKTINNVQVTPNLAVLNTNTNPFEWTAPQISSNIPSLVGHTADLVGNYMIIAFGKHHLIFT